MQASTAPIHSMSSHSMKLPAIALEKSGMETGYQISSLTLISIHVHEQVYLFMQYILVETPCTSLGRFL